MAATEEKVINIIADQLGVDKASITRDTDIANDLGADSLD
ncbi:MAG: acyl carrier protein, partial [Thermoguttaceae bacterium]|nr:acyl carrier protein [Thermoguttaceae bacterium]